MSAPRPLMLISSLLLAGACAADTGPLDTGGDERSDKQSTASIEGTFCHYQGNRLSNFDFELIEMSFDGGSQDRKDTGTATLIGKLFCNNSKPAEPCHRTIVTADYNASWDYLQFTPTSVAEYDQSTGEISDKPLIDAYVLAWDYYDKYKRLALKNDRNEVQSEDFYKVSSWDDEKCDPELSELGL